MKLTVNVKLNPTPKQHEALLRTIEAANDACNYLSKLAWENKAFRQYDLHHLAYYDVKERFGLSAQLTIRMIAKVANAYKRSRNKQCTFKRHGSISYDSRILSFRLKDNTVSIWTVSGRERITFQAGKRQLDLLKLKRCESLLCFLGNVFFLNVVVEVEEPPVIAPHDWLGVDLGIKNIAADSDGELYSGGHLNGLRRRHERLRARLQRKGTKSARRLLKKRRGKEARFARSVNHTIAKRLVEKAKGTGRGIALENLKGIRNQVTVRKSQRRQLASWSFADLRRKIEYKAVLAGIPLVFISPQNTSRTCPICDCVDKRNRLTQSIFSCIRCGFSGHADIVAAENIRRAAVNQPYISDVASPRRQG